MPLYVLDVGIANKKALDLFVQFTSFLKTGKLLGLMELFIIIEEGINRKHIKMFPGKVKSVSHSSLYLCKSLTCSKMRFDV